MQAKQIPGSGMKKKILPYDEVQPSIGEDIAHPPSQRLRARLPAQIVDGIQLGPDESAIMSMTSIELAAAAVVACHAIGQAQRHGEDTSHVKERGEFRDTITLSSEHIRGLCFHNSSKELEYLPTRSRARCVNRRLGV